MAEGLGVCFLVCLGWFAIFSVNGGVSFWGFERFWVEVLVVAFGV